MMKRRIAYYLALGLCWLACMVALVYLIWSW